MRRIFRVTGTETITVKQTVNETCTAEDIDQAKEDFLSKSEDDILEIWDDSEILEHTNDLVVTEVRTVIENVDELKAALDEYLSKATIRLYYISSESWNHTRPSLLFMTSHAGWLVSANDDDSFNIRIQGQKFFVLTDLQLETLQKILAVAQEIQSKQDIKDRFPDAKF